MSYPNETTKLVLQYPVTFNGVEFTEVTIRRPKVRDQLIANKSSKEIEDKETKLLSLLTEKDEEFILELDMSDYFSIQNVIENFRKGKSKKNTSKKV